MKTIKKYFKTNEALKQQIDQMAQENVDFLNKLKEINEEKDMIKKLARTQEQEVQDNLRRAFESEEKFKEIQAQLKLYKQGLEVHEGEIKALSVVRVKHGEDGETWAPIVFTLNEKGTKVLKREAKPDTHLKYAIENAKISFIQMFDPEMEALN